MRKAVAVGIIGFSILAGCSAGYDAAMQIKNNQTEELLMGTFDGSIALIHGSTKEASISVTDGGCHVRVFQRQASSAQI